MNKSFNHSPTARRRRDLDEAHRVRRMESVMICLLEASKGGHKCEKNTKILKIFRVFLFVRGKKRCDLQLPKQSQIANLKSKIQLGFAFEKRLQPARARRVTEFS